MTIGPAISQNVLRRTLQRAAIALVLLLITGLTPGCTTPAHGVPQDRLQTDRTIPRIEDLPDRTKPAPPPDRPVETLPIEPLRTAAFSNPK